MSGAGVGRLALDPGRAAPARSADRRIGGSATRVRPHAVMDHSRKAVPGPGQVPGPGRPRVAYLVSGASFGSLAYASTAFSLVTMTGGRR